MSAFPSVLTLPVPGWYPDPVGAATYRWWDGDTWTEGTHAAPPVPPAQSHPQPPAPAAAPLRAPATRPAPAVRRGVSPAKTRWFTLLSAFPVVYPIAVGMIVALAYAGGAASSMVTLAIIAAVAAVGLLTPAWVFAGHDRRELVARGYEPAPSLAWMLLLPPIAYLITRRRVVGPTY